MRAPIASVLVALALLPLASWAPAARAQPVEVKTVVVGLTARRGVDEGLAIAMSDVVQGVYARAPGRTVLGREDINRVLRFETERQSLGCDTDSCLSEIAQALDVDRLVTGSMDKVGSSYFIVLSEIDARSIEPVGRVQGQLPLDEDQLLPGVTALAQKLLQESSAGVPSAGGGPGSLVVLAKPEGARVRVAGKDVGVTPVTVEALPPGTHEVQIVREGFAPVRVAVPVYGGDATEVRGELAAAPKPTSEQLAAHADAVVWHEVGMWSKLGTGSLCALTSLPCGVATGLTFGVAGGSSDVGFWGCAAAQAALGAALCSWAAVDLLLPPEPPVGEGEPRHELEIVPPPAHGQPQRVETVASQAAVMPH